MTTESHRQGLSPTINIYRPNVGGGNYTVRSQFVGSYSKQIDRYRHTIQAMGGYWIASFTIKDRQDRIEDWIDQGLGRHVEVYDNALNTIWRGFVNRVRADLGALSVQRGPLQEVTNRADLTYSTVDTSTNPPTVGQRERVGQVEDTDSQDLYGILETYLSSGGATDDEATEALNQYLEEQKDPKTTQTVTLGRRTEPKVRVDCLGYVHFFKKYVFNQVANSGDQNLSAKLEAVITDQPNALIDTGYEHIDANTVQVKQYENDDKTAWDVIKTLIALGDAADARYLFGIYDNEVPYYEAAPTTLEYQMRLADPAQRIETMQGEMVYPWNVLPGRWLLFSDLLVGTAEMATLRLDPRAMFIEGVTFTAPWGLSMRGGDVDKLSQKLAKMGLAGIGG